MQVARHQPGNRIAPVGIAFETFHHHFFECHGRIDQMPLTWRQQPLQMQWCLACHRNPAPHLHAKEDVFRMPPPSVSEAETQDLARMLKLESRQRMTDCSTCHR